MGEVECWRHIRHIQCRSAPSAAGCPVRDFLIYTSAGHASNVRQWWLSTDRNYDIWVTNYTDTPALNSEYCEYYNERKGSKFQNLKAVFETHRSRLAGYKGIMVADDDIIMPPRALSALLGLLEEHDLWVLQPAFSRFGKISHKITARRLRTALRYTNFVEVTCPVFRTDKLMDFLAAYRPELSTCYGIDWWFMAHLGADQQQRYAISDRYYCINPRDCFKAGRRREIDRLGTHEQRVAMWRTIECEVGVHSFRQREYSRLGRRTLERLTCLPVFVAEALFDEAFSALVKFKRSLNNSGTDSSGQP